MSLDIAEMKRMVWWGLPLMCFTIALCVWGFMTTVPTTYVDLQQRAPGLRFSPVALLMPFFALMCAGMILIMPLRIWRIEKFASWVKKYLVIGPLIAFFIGLPTVFIGGEILQQTYLPEMGYTECNQLRGARSTLSTDWVKDPAWCVRNKDHAWVREQAAKAEKKQKNNESPSSTK